MPLQPVSRHQRPTTTFAAHGPQLIPIAVVPLRVALVSPLLNSSTASAAHVPEDLGTGDAGNRSMHVCERTAR